MGLRQRLSERFPYGFPEPYETREANWRAAVEAPRGINDATAALILAALEKQLDRTTAGRKSLDDKASLIVHGVGIIATIVGTNVSAAILAKPQEHLAMVVLLVALFVFAALSVLLAMVCLGPFWTSASGTQPRAIVLRTNDDPGAATLGLINALGFAVESSNTVLLAKAFWFSWSIGAAAGAVLALLVFLLLGGLRQ